MKHLSVLHLLIAVVVAIIVIGVGFESDWFVIEQSERESPLTDPIAVTAVNGGTITLQDGRSFRPAGIVCRPTVTASDFDAALRTATAQGVVVTRDLGDGSAFVIVEPKFYNWCGKHRGFTHWAGSYIQMSLSEAMILCRYAVPDIQQSSLTEGERQRLDVVERSLATGAEPRRMSTTSGSFEFEASDLLLAHLDNCIEPPGDQPPSR